MTLSPLVIIAKTNNSLAAKIYNFAIAKEKELPKAVYSVMMMATVFLLAVGRFFSSIEPVFIRVVDGIVPSKDKAKYLKICAIVLIVAALQINHKKMEADRAARAAAPVQQIKVEPYVPPPMPQLPAVPVAARLMESK